MSVPGFPPHIEAVCDRTARRVGPEARPGIVGAAAKHQIEALAMRGEHGVPASSGPRRHSPVAVGEIAVIAGDLDHPVQRDVLDASEFSHGSLRVPGLAFVRMQVQSSRLGHRPHQFKVFEHEFGSFADFEAFGFGALGKILPVRGEPQGKTLRELARASGVAIE